MLAKFSAILAPIPRLAPVIRTFFPLNFIFFSFVVCSNSSCTPIATKLRSQLLDELFVLSTLVLAQFCHTRRTILELLLNFLF